MTDSAHNIITNPANSVFSTTKHLSTAEKNYLLTKYPSKRIPTELGNIIPHVWYKKFTDKNGGSDLADITLESKIFSLYRFSLSLCPAFYNNLYEIPVLILWSLRLYYDHFTEKFYFGEGVTV